MNAFARSVLLLSVVFYLAWLLLSYRSGVNSVREQSISDEIVNALASGSHSRITSSESWVRASRSKTVVTLAKLDGQVDLNVESARSKIIGPALYHILNSEEAREAMPGTIHNIESVALGGNSIQAELSALKLGNIRNINIGYVRDNDLLATIIVIRNLSESHVLIVESIK